MDIFWKPHSFTNICTVCMFQTFDQWSWNMLLELGDSFEDHVRNSVWLLCLQNLDKNHYQWLQKFWRTGSLNSLLSTRFQVQIWMIQGQSFKMSKSYDQGKGYIVLFSRVLLEYFPCLQTCVIIHWKIIVTPVLKRHIDQAFKSYWFESSLSQSKQSWRHVLATRLIF